MDTMFALLTRHALLAAGWLFLSLGVIGVFLPVMPTAPFVIVAAVCFARSSKRVHGWLVAHPLFGPHLDGYLSGRGMKRRAKVFALGSMWAGMAFSTLLIVPYPLADAAIVGGGIVATAYILWWVPTAPDVAE